MSEADGFLARWSRRKTRANEGEVVPAEPPAAAVDPESESTTQPGSVVAPVPGTRPASAASDALAEPVERAAAVPPTPELPTLDDVALLTRSSDYSRFVAPGVDPSVKNAAMKKLFSDPHFNVMDGLDTYIDDYGKPDPIPESMLRRMVQSKFLGLFNDEDKEKEEDVPEASTDGVAALPLSQSDLDAGTPASEPEAPLP